MLEEGHTELEWLYKPMPAPLRVLMYALAVQKTSSMLQNLPIIHHLQTDLAK